MDVENIQIDVSNDPPVDPPIDIPTDPPVDAPVEPPVDPPVDAPVDALVDPPVDAPVDIPTDPLVEPPVDAPIEPPVDAPVEPPVDPPRMCYITDTYRSNVEKLCDEYSNNILKLDCMKFNLNIHDTRTSTIGLLEEAIVEYYPELVPLNSQGIPYTINYELFTVLLLHQLQQMEKRIQILENN